jgi:hypothetical protein
MTHNSLSSLNDLHASPILYIYSILAQLEVLIDQALEEKSSHESFGVLSRELHLLFKTSTSNVGFIVIFLNVFLEEIARFSRKSAVKECN